MKEQRHNHVTGRRSPFAEIARDAIQRALGESRTAEAHWHLGINVAWVRFPEDGRWTFIGIHRHLDWLSGDAGTAGEPCELSDLFPLPGSPERSAPGYRIRLGDLLGGEDRWWRAGADEQALAERLEWMAIQLRVKGQAYFAHHPQPAP
jgi:hypothetical protein